MITTHCTPPQLPVAAALRTLTRLDATDAELLSACRTLEDATAVDQDTRERATHLRHLIEGEMR